MTTPLDVAKIIEPMMPKCSAFCVILAQPGRTSKKLDWCSTPMTRETMLALLNTVLLVAMYPDGDDGLPDDIKHSWMRKLGVDPAAPHITSAMVDGPLEKVKQTLRALFGCSRGYTLVALVAGQHGLRVKVLGNMGESPTDDKGIEIVRSLADELTESCAAGLDPDWPKR